MHAPARRLVAGIGRALLIGLAAGAALGAAPVAIPEAETQQAPTPARLVALAAAAGREGWSAQTGVLRDAAVLAYDREQLAAADAWYHVGRWAALFGETSANFQVRWVEALRTAKASLPVPASSLAGRGRLLGDPLTPEFQAWVLEHPEFSTEFFALLSPLDHVPGVLRALNELHFQDPARFATYAHLALAMAVVYDVPPPAGWPHRQVTAAALPRKLPSARDAFAWWTRQDERGRTYHRLTALGAADLKFVIDAAAPLAELEWSLEVADYPLAQLPRAYTMIRYRPERVAKNELIWPQPTYRLPDILAEGGICVDQAYFATEVGKARGVPTLVFRGEGQTGRHAWFGFLDGERQWRLDAGRVAEQRLMTGVAYDPQTWREITEHDLKFLTAEFRGTAAFRQARIHAEFAQAFLLAGDAARAIACARRAIDAEPRHQSGWDVLVAALEAGKKSAPEIEAALRGAQRAFERYPDLETHYASRLAASLRARGETAAAENEERRIAGRNEGSRTDLNLRQARARLLRAVESQPVAEQIRVYESVVDEVGRVGGFAFFDQIVVGFAGHLAAAHQNAEAVRAVERAQRALAPAAGSTLEQDFTRLLAQVKAAP